MLRCDAAEGERDCTACIRLVGSSADACFAAPPLWSAVGLDATAAAASAISALGRALSQLTAAALALAGEVEHPVCTTIDAQLLCWVCQCSLPDRAYTALYRAEASTIHQMTYDCMSTSAADIGVWSGAHPGRCMRCTARRQPAITMHHMHHGNTSWETNAAPCGRLWHIWRVQTDMGAHKHLDVSLRRDNTVGTATVNDAVGLAPGVQEQVNSR
jgi:hypothetical protein